MRKNPTQGESALKAGLLNEIKSTSNEFEKSLLEFSSQHILYGYVLDFYFKKSKIAVEVDGIDHKYGKQKKWDDRRDRAIGDCGIKTLRFTNEEVINDTSKVCSIIKKENIKWFGLEYDTKEKKLNGLKTSSTEILKDINPQKVRVSTVKSMMSGLSTSIDP